MSIKFSSVRVAAIVRSVDPKEEILVYTHLFPISKRTSWRFVLDTMPKVTLGRFGDGVDRVFAATRAGGVGGLWCPFNHLNAGSHSLEAG